MGELHYGKLQFELSDLDASYLSVVIAQACMEKLSFVFHITVGGEGDGDIVAVVLGYGHSSALKFPNADNGVEWGYVVAAMREIREKGTLSISLFSAL